MAMGDIAANLRRVGARISSAAARADRDPATVELLVVSKTWPVPALQDVLDAGHHLLGENKLQEAAAKIPALPTTTRWHFIGHLQRNKARKALELFETIHSVDSLKLAIHLDRIAGELKLKSKIYLQLNATEEESKSGFSEGELRESLDALLALEHLRVEGLMSIPPAVESPEEARLSFRELAGLRDELQDRWGVALPGLSMGMSHDFEIAIEEGATIVRVGSSIFGPRHVKPGASE
jgi:pyridoxal phosphate enzyme (YggS family)